MHAVIMAGGAGTRFWPISRQHKPKQLLDITGHGPMIVETCDRLSPVCDDSEMIIVLGKDHLADTRALFPDRSIHLLAEPVGRNTAPCIGLGAIMARHLGCKGAVAFLPADHYIAKPGAFIESLKTAGALAEEGGIVTLGIVPNKPETGFGYIRREAFAIDVHGMTAYDVLEFVEKPDLVTATRYLKSGEYYWNAGIFVATPETILAEIRNFLPTLYEGLVRLEKAMETEAFNEALFDVYQQLEGISFDYGIMEKTQEKVSVIPCECGWSDVGSWSSLYDLRSGEYDENRNLGQGETLLIDCKGGFVSAKSGRLVTCLGLEDILVVDTPDALLVTRLDRSQDIRKTVDQLKKDGKENLL